MPNRSTNRPFRKAFILAALCLHPSCIRPSHKLRRSSGNSAATIMIPAAASVNS